MNGRIPTTTTVNNFVFCTIHSTHVGRDALKNAILLGSKSDTCHTSALYLPRHRIAEIPGFLC